MELRCPALPPLLLLLAVLPKAESPPLHLNCHDGEYAYSGICCLECPAGSYVEEPCSEPHTQGRCRLCTEGEDFTAHRNGLPQCLPCDECKHGKIEVKPCTMKSNTICQCKDGYYCPPICEECIRCTQKCPEGQVIVRKCNATADLECGTPSGEDPLKYIFFAVMVPVVLLFCIGFIFLYKKKCRVSKSDEDSKHALIPHRQNTPSPKAAYSNSKDQKSGLGDSPSLSKDNVFEIEDNNANKDLSHETIPSAPPLSRADDPGVPLEQSNGLNSNAKCPEVIVTNPSHPELNKLYYDSRHTVPHYDWKMLMRRMGLSDNDIHKIIRDNYNADEQDYQMLKTIQDRFGIDDALCKLLNSLWDMKLARIYENLFNELISNDIIALKNN